MTDAQQPAGNGPQPADATNAPAIQVIAQYLHDLSFENPNAPDSLISGWGAPETGVQINLRHRAVKDDLHETMMVLKIEAKHKQQDKTAFIIEISYGALVALKNVPENQVRPVMLVEVPKILFPFVREAVADAVQKGGFPPLYLQPISFEALYVNQVKRMQEEAKKSANA